MLKLLPLGLLMIVVAGIATAGGIDMGAPLTSGAVSLFRNDGSINRKNLSSEQLQALTGWLERRRSGWQGEITEASPNEQVELQIKVKHADDSITAINVMVGVRGGHLLRLTGPGTWAYRSFLGLYKTWAANRRLSDQEFAVLRDLVGETP
jgi:hypothetical protein